MENLCSIDKKDLPQIYDFSTYEIIIDVGGGTGVILFSILEHNPNLKGILYDLPQPIETAKKKFKSNLIFNRCEFIEGDFLERIPTGGQCYILRHIIHDWDDQMAVHILNNCRQSMHQSGKILVMETIVDKSKDYPLYHLKDLHMLVSFPRGKERTLQEYEELFRLAELKLQRIINLPSQMSIMELVII
jgi:ubiquinone/menaquinone biosynthesis C-methylase UbiE